MGTSAAVQAHDLLTGILMDFDLSLPEERVIAEQRIAAAIKKRDQECAKIARDHAYKEFGGGPSCSNYNPAGLEAAMDIVELLEKGA